MKKFYITDRLSKRLCSDNPDILFVFGDNLIGKGTAGQACIRYCDNSMGIPTKRLPSMTDGAFFSDMDSEWELIKEKIDELESYFKEGRDVGFAKTQLGRGLAKMDIYSPKNFQLMIISIELLVDKYYYEFVDMDKEI